MAKAFPEDKCSGCEHHEYCSILGKISRDILFSSEDLSSIELNLRRRTADCTLFNRKERPRYV